jgi:hypothetical protein
MPIDVKCPKCDPVTTVTFRDEDGGRTGLCPVCGVRMTIPKSGGHRAGMGSGAMIMGLAILGGVTILLLAAGAAGFLWWRAHRGEEVASSSSSGGSGSSSSSSVASTSSASSSGSLDLGKARDISVDSVGIPTVATGRLTKADDVELFFFRAPSDGLMTARQVGAFARPECRLTGLDFYTKEIPNWPPWSSRRPREVSFRVRSGEIYYLKVTASAPGAFELELAIINDDYGDTFETAYTIDLSEKGDAFELGTINFAGDEDMFRVEAKVTGRMTVWQETGVSSPLECQVTIYDDKNRSTPYAFGTSALLADSKAEFDVVKGRVYFIKAAAKQPKTERGATGGYSIFIETAPNFDKNESRAKLNNTRWRVVAENSGEGGEIWRFGDNNVATFTFKDGVSSEGTWEQKDLKVFVTSGDIRMEGTITPDGQKIDMKYTNYDFKPFTLVPQK